LNDPKRAGETAAARSASAIAPRVISSAASRPTAGLVSMPVPPWPASQKKPGRTGSSPTTSLRSGAKVRRPARAPRICRGRSGAASRPRRASASSMPAASGRASHGGDGTSSIGQAMRPGPSVATYTPRES